MLWVQVKSAYEAESAERGGADAVLLTGDDPTMSPLPHTVDLVRAATTVQLRVLLRLQAGDVTDGGRMTRLRGLASSFHSAGVDGFAFGFLNAMSGIDVEACQTLAGDAAWPWMFDRAVDNALDQDRAWEEVHRLPRVDAVMSAGSARGVEHGIDRVITHADDQVPAVVTGGLLPEHIPWLVNAGMRRFLIDDRAPSPDTVRSWRRLIDDEVDRATRRADHQR
jgi:copper homeostasis protein